MVRETWAWAWWSEAAGFLGKEKIFCRKHEPLVTRDLFDRANIAMGLKSRPKKNKHNLAFTGMVKRVAK